MPLVQSRSAVVIGVNNTTLAFTSSVTAGNLIVVTQSHYSSPAQLVTTPTDSLFNAYVPAVAEQVITITSDALKLRTYYVENCLGGSCTVTFDIASFTTGDITVSIAEFSGIVTSGALDKTQSAATTSTAVSSGVTATTAQADELIYGAMMFNGVTTTIDETTGGSSGFTLIQENEAGTTSMPIATEYKEVTATGAYDAKWTLGASRQWAGHVATFKKVATTTAVLTGTAIGGITEADVVAGGKVITVTLTGDTFIT